MTNLEQHDGLHCVALSLVHERAWPCLFPRCGMSYLDPNPRWGIVDAMRAHRLHLSAQAIANRTRPDEFVEYPLRCIPGIGIEERQEAFRFHAVPGLGKGEYRFLFSELFHHALPSIETCAQANLPQDLAGFPPDCTFLNTATISLASLTW